MCVFFFLSYSESNLQIILAVPRANADIVIIFDASLAAIDFDKAHRIRWGKHVIAASAGTIHFRLYNFKMLNVLVRELFFSLSFFFGGLKQNNFCNIKRLGNQGD